MFRKPKRFLAILLTYAMIIGIITTMPMSVLADLSNPDCGEGGTIAPPISAGTAGIRVINGNALAGTSGNDANRRVLSVF